MESYLEKLVRVLGIGGAFATLPLLAAFSQLEPPNPPAIAYVSSALILLAALLAWEFGKGTARAIRRRRILVSTLVGIVGLVSYLFLNVSYVESIPGSDVRVVRGYVCTPQALEIYSEYCPDIPKDMIAEANWETKKLWTRASVSHIEILLIVTWLIFIMGLIGAVGSIVASDKKKPN
jgi:hypothetical protein